MERFNLIDIVSTLSNRQFMRFVFLVSLVQIKSNCFMEQETYHAYGLKVKRIVPKRHLFFPGEGKKLKLTVGTWLDKHCFADKKVWLIVLAEILNGKPTRSKVIQLKALLQES